MKNVKFYVSDQSGHRNDAYLTTRCARGRLVVAGYTSWPAIRRGRLYGVAGYTAWPAIRRGRLYGVAGYTAWPGTRHDA